MFSDNFLQYLIDTLQLENSIEELRDVIEGYNKELPKKAAPKDSKKSRPSERDEEEVKLPKRKEVPKPASKKLCERIQRGKTEPCGKKATNSIIDPKGVEHWYCGSEKTGCYKCMLGQDKKAKNKKMDREIIEEKARPAKTTKTTSTTKKTSILDTIASKQQVINPKKYQTASGKTVFLEMSQRILFDPDTKEAYASLDDDNDTISPLSKKQLGWLEVHNIPVKDSDVQEKKAPLKKRIMDADDEDTLNELKKELIKKEIGKGNDDSEADDIEDDEESEASESEEEYNDVDID